MLLDQLLAALKTALSNRVSWPIYDEYDPTLLEKRADWFLTVGVTSIDMQDPFLSAEYLYYPFTATIRVTLLVPPSTHVRELYDNYCQWVFSGMLSAGCTIQKIRIDKPDERHKLGRLSMTGHFGMDGVFQMRKEEAKLSS